MNQTLTAADLRVGLDNLFSDPGRLDLFKSTAAYIVYGTELDEVRALLPLVLKGMSRYGLGLHPEKTRLLPFRRPPKGQKSGKGPPTFDFLGFTLHYARTRDGQRR